MAGIALLRKGHGRRGETNKILFWSLQESDWGSRVGESSHFINLNEITGGILLPVIDKLTMTFTMSLKGRVASKVEISYFRIM